MSILNEIVSAQKRGEARGIPSICSAHPWVLRAAMDRVLIRETPLLIEATCNQVNQFGGYTGMRPQDFFASIRGLASENHFPQDNILLGGDHLGPSVWQNEPADKAMQKAEELVWGYVQAGFTKIHLDASMNLGDDPAGVLPVEVCATRAARLAKMAESARVDEGSALRYVIGTEVPVPGGAKEYEEGVGITLVGGVQETIEVTRRAFQRAGIESAWERVMAVVVQPGVEFGDDFVLDYQPEKARSLAEFIEGIPGLVYEAHSTDYQAQDALKNLVRDHFAILKVGPALTFAFREAAFVLAMMENELFPTDQRSHLIDVLNAVMVRHPEHWQKYYQGSISEQAFKRKFSLSDRIRYYWGDAAVQTALERLLMNLRQTLLPFSLLSQYAPMQAERIRAGEIKNSPTAIILDRIGGVLEDYAVACGE